MSPLNRKAPSHPAVAVPLRRRPATSALGVFALAICTSYAPQAASEDGCAEHAVEETQLFTYTTTGQGEAPASIDETKINVELVPAAQSQGGCGERCRSFGGVHLEFEPALDPDSSPDDVGYHIEAFGGPGGAFVSFEVDDSGRYTDMVAEHGRVRFLADVERLGDDAYVLIAAIDRQRNMGPRTGPVYLR